MAKKNPDFIKDNGNGTVAITLSRPADVEGAKVAVLTMREPTVEDQLTTDERQGSAAAKEIGLFADLCMVSPETIRKLPLRDYMRLQTGYGFFID